jgi:hypothetical protein
MNSLDYSLAPRTCLALLFATTAGPKLPTKNLVERRRNVAFTLQYLVRDIDRDRLHACMNKRQFAIRETALFRMAKLCADLRKSRIDPWHLPLLDAIDRALSE